MKNLSLSKKLYILVAVAVILNICGALFAMYRGSGIVQMVKDNHETVSVPMTHLIDMSNAYARIRIGMRDYILSDFLDRPSIKTSLNDDLNIFRNSLTKYKSFFGSYGIVSGIEIDNTKTIESLMDKLTTEVNNAMNVADKNSVFSANEYMHNNIEDVSDKIYDALSKLTENKEYQSTHTYERVAFQKRRGDLIVIIIIILSVIALCLNSSYIVRSITKPISQLVKASQDLTNGKLSMNIPEYGKNEIGELFSAFGKVVGVFRKFIDDINQNIKLHADGDYDARISDSGYPGEYKEIVSGINNMVESYVLQLNDVVGMIDAFGRGDFKHKMNKYPGKRGEVNIAVESVRANLNSLVSDINSLIEKTVEGQLSSRADASKFEGDWALILNGLNNVLDAVVTPINEAIHVMENISNGHFNLSMNGTYKGDYNLIKNSLNKIVTNTSGYIREISNVLDELAQNNLNQQIKREYIGEFAGIKNSLNNILDEFNHVMTEITSAAEQVNIGAKQIADSSMSLATDTSKQSSFVDVLSTTVSSINDKTRENFEYTKKADDLSDSTNKSATEGNGEMQALLSSMDGIEEATHNISKIIKVISDIAMQTNLLALNASVEAARAGQYGKGFAVVAEEVRSLANRTQIAVKDTSELIEDTISRVSQGKELANNTASVLGRIVTSANEVSDVITSIASASEKQMDSVSEIKTGIENITDVVRNNSAMSEENAAVSEELSSQANILLHMINAFKLR